jgi:hypothetical protein
VSAAAITAAAAPVPATATATTTGRVRIHRDEYTRGGENCRQQQRVDRFHFEAPWFRTFMYRD